MKTVRILVPLLVFFWLLTMVMREAVVSTFRDPTIGEFNGGSLLGQSDLGLIARWNAICDIRDEIGRSSLAGSNGSSGKTSVSALPEKPESRAAQQDYGFANSVALTPDLSSWLHTELKASADQQHAATEQLKRLGTSAKAKLVFSSCTLRRSVEAQSHRDLTEANGLSALEMLV